VPELVEGKVDVILFKRHVDLVLEIWDMPRNYQSLYQHITDHPITDHPITDHPITDLVFRPCFSSYSTTK
jgi:hypothetical protein